MKITMKSNSENFTEFWKQHKNIIVEALRPDNINNESYPLRVQLDMKSVEKDSPLIPIILELQDELGYLLEGVHNIISLFPQEQIMNVLRKYIPMWDGDSLLDKSLEHGFELGLHFEYETVFDTLFRSKNLEAVEYMLQSPYIRKYCIGGGQKLNLTLKLDGHEWEDWERRLWGKLNEDAELRWESEFNYDFADHFDEYYTQQLKLIGVQIEFSNFFTYFTIPNHFDWTMFEETVSVIKTMLTKSIEKVMSICITELNKQGIGAFQLSPLGVFDNNGGFHKLCVTEIVRHLRPNTYGFSDLTKRICENGFEQMLEKLS